MWAAQLAERYPLVQVDPKVLYVDAGDILTSAGTAAGIDLTGALPSPEPYLRSARRRSLRRIPTFFAKERSLMTLGQPPVLTARTTFHHDHAVMAVAGELDMSTAADLYDALAEVVDRHPRELTVDLADLAFIDSTGLTLLVRTSKQLQEHDATLWLSSPTPTVRRVLEIVGLDHLLVA